jgi:hypothetical protein
VYVFIQVNFFLGSADEPAQQQHAIEKAIAKGKNALNHDHIDHRLEIQPSADAASAKAAFAVNVTLNHNGHAHTSIKPRLQSMSIITVSTTIPFHR